MNISTRHWPFLMDADTSEPKLRSVCDDSIREFAMTKDISSPAGGVRSTPAGVAHFNIVIRAAISATDAKWESTADSQKIEFIYKDGDHYVLVATASTGELVKYEVDPSHMAVVRSTRA